MPKNRKKIMEEFRCPLCLSRECETFVKYDPKHKDYYCSTCEYTGTENDVKKMYAVITSRFKLLNKRIKTF
ncbi:MAG TPA: hypothetical protein DET40_19820 [Lentisphaeria bacterium]|nr:MAG: hypothetical protein A2X45_11065 [Lentisphaerae bacterium GWF2_50_93]HCE45798.1 hypothetical protein [Lentisphaeria bacterium]